MAHPTKPGKPCPDFPLLPHATRRWAEKIRGKFHYFGPWDDPEGTLEKYLDQKEDLYAGRVPRVQASGVMVRDFINQFLTSRARNGKRMFEADQFRTLVQIGVQDGSGAVPNLDQPGPQ